MSTNVPVCQYTCSVYFFFFGITYTMTFQLIYWGTYTQIHPKLNIPVYLHASLESNHNDVPVTTTTCVPAHSCTHSWPYLFIFRLSFQLTVKINPSTFILFYMYTDVAVHHYTCSVYFFFFGIACTMTFQLIYWGAYKQIHLKIFLPVYHHASLSSNHKDLPVTTAACVHAHRCTHSGPYAFLPLNVPDHDPACSFSYFYMINCWDLPVIVPTALPVHRYIRSWVYLFSIFPFLA